MLADSGGAYALPPSHFLVGLVFLDLFAVTLALGMGVVLHEDPSAYTDDLFGDMLLGSAYSCAFITAARRWLAGLVDGSRR